MHWPWPQSSPHRFVLCDILCGCACLIFLTVCLPASVSHRVCHLSLSLSSSSSPGISGDVAQAVILYKLELKVTAVSPFSSSSTVLVHLLHLCPLMLPLAVAQSHCVCVSVPPTFPGPCPGPIVLTFCLCSVSPTPAPQPASALGHY